MIYNQGMCTKNYKKDTLESLQKVLKHHQAYTSGATYSAVTYKLAQ
jgi:hypothetical protein